MPLEVHFEKKLPSYTLCADFSAEEEPLAILGPSGSGKSMTLRCVAGLEHPDRGTIALDGRTLFDSNQRIGIPARRREIGLLFQHYALFPHLSVAENIAFGMKASSGADRGVRVRRLLSDVHLEGFENRLPRELSGGEQQRVALARALAIEPQALLLDEPLSALDTFLRSQVEQQLILTLAQFRRPALYVTHTMEEAYRIAPKILVLSKGKVAAFGSREQIFRHPPTLEVALLTGLKNFSRTRVVSAGKIEALDWNCVVCCDVEASTRPAYVGIRAHHIRFASSPDEANCANTFPCWLVRTSEAPFRVTVYLRLHSPEGEHHHLQAEITKENWLHLKDQPQPWRVLLPPIDVLVLAS
ncbi:MAG TPA: sulfate/molybdate ABC transporter ATP-binding protein [Verrucomicrobiae bacterium]|nr:sulfate/molybdate ABC transporter ATP-binding protein [Verrucomicrobiae bacterium]